MWKVDLGAGAEAGRHLGICWCQVGEQNSGEQVGCIYDTPGIILDDH